MKKRKKPKTVKEKLFDKAWKLMSEYVRRRDKGVCFTCGKIKPWKEMHAGHWKHGRLDFNEKAINCQCCKCNTFNSGKLDEYTMNLIRKYSVEEVEELELLANTTTRKDLMISDLETIIIDLRTKLEDLSNE